MPKERKLIGPADIPGDKAQDLAGGELLFDEDGGLATGWPAHHKRAVRLADMRPKLPPHRSFGYWSAATIGAWIA